MHRIATAKFTQYRCVNNRIITIRERFLMPGYFRSLSNARRRCRDIKKREDKC